MHTTSRKNIGQGEHGRMHWVYQGEERIKAFQDPSMTQIKI